MQSSPSLKGIRLKFRAKAVSEGEGCTLLRAMPTQTLPNLDPFLLFDHPNTNVGQFPDHPHRGFETVGLIFKGAVRHEDSKGLSGEDTEGGARWMTAGKGIVHAEKIDSRGIHGLQCWINLKSSMKFCEPGYQQFSMGSICRAEDRGAGISASIVAGSALGSTASTFTRTPTSIIDFTLQDGSTLLQPMNPGWNSLLYPIEGRVRVSGTSLGPSDCAVLTPEEPMVEVLAEKKSRFILISGEPINEPCVQYGPFVMNTREEIAQAFDDYERGVNGFEGAPTWRSQLFYSGGRRKR